MSKPLLWHAAGLSPYELAAVTALSILLALVLAVGHRSRRGTLAVCLLLALSGFGATVWMYESQRDAPVAAESGAADAGGDLYACDATRFLNPRRLFGADAARARIEDARALFGDVLARAAPAQTASFPEGATVLVARFANAAEVAEAAQAYLRRFRVELATGDLTQGLRGQRGDLSDRVELLLDGDVLVVWTARNDAALAARRLASEAGRGAREGNK